MTQQPQDPHRKGENQTVPKSLLRMEAFIQERLASGEVDEQGDVIPVEPAELPSREAQIEAYRDLQVQHNPVFSGVNANRGGNQGGGNVDPGLLIGAQNIPDDLLKGHFYPVGPAALLNGSANNRPVVSGRITALSVGNDGKRIYAGAANGGVWRSDNGGVAWRPLMNAIHFAPTTEQSDSLAIGAVAMDPDQPDRIFVGTGEGPGRVSLAGSPEFFGVGPLYSGDGGYTWKAESVDDSRLSGSAFFNMIVDPIDRDKVTSASRHGVMQRQPRNRRIASDFKPQNYFYRHAFNSGALSSYYLNKAGTAQIRAWAGGGGFLAKTDILTPFEFNGIPYFFQYDHDAGDVMVDFWKGNGRPSLTLTGGRENIGKGWDLFLPVTLMGRTYMLTYSGATGLATLWFLEITNDFLFYDIEPVWENKNFGKGWTNFFSVNIEGQPYFLAYNRVSGTATLQQWLPNGEFVRVWRQNIPANLRIMTFNLGASAYWFWLGTARGDGQLNLWNSDGTFDVIRVYPNDTFDGGQHPQLVPYQFENEARFYVYDFTNGNTNSFRFARDWSLDLIENLTWEADLIVASFEMGFEWINPTFTPVPAPSPNVSGTTTATASGLAMARSAGETHYYAAFWDDKVYRSIDNGETWRVLGTGFPSKAGRVAIASQRDNKDVVYAFTQDGSVYRWDVRDNQWRKSSGVPPKDELVGKQGFYDLAVAVSPNDVNTIYLGGSSFSGGAGLYRCKVTFSIGIISNSVSMVPTWIGSSVHADVHVLGFTECHSDALWVGCDGGVFFSDIATTTDATKIPTMFKARNCGLGTQTVNFLTQHPTEDAILFCGTQDNGCQLSIGNEAWKPSSRGDGGKVLIDWSTPAHVILPSINNKFSTSNNGGSDPARNTGKEIPGVSESDTLFYPPYAGTPVGVGVDPLSQRVAYGSKRVWVNDGFGADNNAWFGLTNANIGSGSGFLIKTLSFVTNRRLLAGLMNGQIYRYDENLAANPVTWTQTRLDNQNGGIGVTGPITGFASDPTDGTNTMFFVCIGGAVKDYRRVWFYDGTQWIARSGPSKNHVNALLDIQYNALAIARINGKTHMFAAADIGIWHSQDGGLHWRPFSMALPETAVFDLHVFPGTVNKPWLLRAATYGRSNYERVIAGGSQELQQSLTKPVQLYIRTNALDRGLYPATTRSVPAYVTNSRETDVRISVDMKMLKSTDGNFDTPAEIDFCEFEALTNELFLPKRTISGRYYVRIHTRGVSTVDQVEVRLIMVRTDDTPEAINDATPPPNLPGNFTTIIRNGNPMPVNSDWIDIGTTFVNGLFAGTPLVTAIDFPLTQEGSYFVLAILNQAKDLFDDRTVNPITLASDNRKVAMAYFISEFN